MYPILIPAKTRRVRSHSGGYPGTMEVERCTGSRW